jgi:hypothetical protein
MVTNALAFYNTAMITTVKSLMVLAPSLCFIHPYVRLSVYVLLYSYQENKKVDTYNEAVAECSSLLQKDLSALAATIVNVDFSLV